MGDELPDIEVRFPVERAVGDYADGMRVSFNEHELIVDFLVTTSLLDEPPAVEVVRRVRLPVAASFDLAQNVAVVMDKYEHRFGPIHRTN